MQGQTYYDRAEVKRQAKDAMKEQWGASIGFYALPTLIGVVTAWFTAQSSSYWSYGTIRTSFAPMIIVLLADLMLIPLSVGICGGFTKVFRREMTGIGDAFSIMSDHFLKKLGASLLYALYVFLWSLLLIVPGIMKAYSYAMVPYILAEYPEIPASRALNLSSRMMAGRRLDLFVLELSFIGWMLLSSLTFGILAIAFAGPYMNTSYAGFYTTVRDIALTNGTIDRAEFES